MLLVTNGDPEAIYSTMSESHMQNISLENFLFEVNTSGFIISWNYSKVLRIVVTCKHFAYCFEIQLFEDNSIFLCYHS